MNEIDSHKLYNEALNFKAQSNDYNYVIHMIIAANKGDNMAINHIKGENFMVIFTKLRTETQLHKFLKSTV